MAVDRGQGSCLKKKKKPKRHKTDPQKVYLVQNVIVLTVRNPAPESDCLGGHWYVEET